MAESAVSFVLDQLIVFLHEEQQLLGGLQREVQYIYDELRQMREFLRVADAKEDTNPGLKEWLRQLREISYDLEDVLDKYTLRFGRRGGGKGFTGCIKNAYASTKNLRALRQIASEIQNIKYRLENVSRTQQRYKDMYDVLDQGSSYAVVTTEGYDGRGDALFLDEADVVGIEKPKKQLLEWIRARVDDGVEVISVVGMGGLGKTTLVKKVFDDESVKKHFNQHVWIVASDYTDVKHLLANLIKKLVAENKESPPQGLENMTVDDMRKFIHEFLKEKKYIIVIDDLWKIPTWEIIKFALPKREGHGCIIITTRFSSIANAACNETNHVYELQPLPTKESRKLFYKKAFPRNLSPPDYLQEIAGNILKRCEGLPLAIVVIGGLLATKNERVEEWDKFNRSIIDEFDEGGSLNRLWKLLSLSYNDLPYYLKSCFLYLNIYPESGLLLKYEIIRLWMAEGFVLPKQTKTMEDVADDYINELVNRSLIQVAELYPDGEEVYKFRIHDLVREFITSKSREQNMVTVYNGEGEMQWPNKIRRLAIQNFVNFPMETINFECLHSLILLCDGNQVVCDTLKELLGRCRLLKVLHVKEASLLEAIPYEVFKLYHLKNLTLRNTVVKLIPRSVKYLVNLETLDLTNSNVTELPTEILKLHKLRHLYVNYRNKKMIVFHNVKGAKVPNGIGNYLSSLQSLCYIDADGVDGTKIVKEIGKLAHLRDLNITKLTSENGKDLCSSIAKLTNLRMLTIYSIEDGEKLDLDYPLSSSSSLPFLRVLELRGCLEKIPQWIPSLNSLTTLYLRWNKLREDPTNSLEGLPNLAYLSIRDTYTERLNFKANRFQKLKTLFILEFRCLKWVIVEKGSMPVLQVCAFKDCKLMIEPPQDIEHLPNLQLLEFSCMADEFLEKIAQEKINEGGNWRLARLPNVRFFNSEGKRMPL